MVWEEFGVVGGGALEAGTVGLGGMVTTSLTVSMLFTFANYKGSSSAAGAGRRSSSAARANDASRLGGGLSSLCRRRGRLFTSRGST